MERDRGSRVLQKRHILKFSACNEVELLTESPCFENVVHEL